MTATTRLIELDDDEVVPDGARLVVPVTMMDSEIETLIKAGNVWSRHISCVDSFLLHQWNGPMADPGWGRELKGHAVAAPDQGLSRAGPVIG
jgi:hypothetical protein